MIEDPAQWLGLQLNLGKDGLRATVSYVNNRGLLLFLFFKHLKKKKEKLECSF